MILFYFIIIVSILFLFISINIESFSYFNLNLNVNTPISYNNDYDVYKKIDYKKSINTMNKPVDIFDNRINFVNISKDNYTNPNITTNLLDSSNCCLVQKTLDNGIFNYKYTLLHNDKCNINLYELDHNNQLFFDKINNWNNNYCHNNNNILGSCRKANMECIDFITEEQCNNINNNAKGNFFLNFDHKNKNNVITTKTIWSNKTCNNWS